MTTYSDESYNIRIKLDTENCELSPGEIEQLEKWGRWVRPSKESGPA